MIKFPKTADHLIGWLLGLVAACVTMAGISVATLKESQEACEIIGRYQAIRQKHGLDAEKIQLHCPDGVFERSVRSSDRFDKRIGEKVFVLESITGLKRL